MIDFQTPKLFKFIRKFILSGWGENCPSNTSTTYSLLSGNMPIYPRIFLFSDSNNLVWLDLKQLHELFQSKAQFKKETSIFYSDKKQSKSRG
jgi:hypothetical protein